MQKDLVLEEIQMSPDQTVSIEVLQLPAWKTGHENMLPRGKSR